MHACWHVPGEMVFDEVAVVEQDHQNLPYQLTYFHPHHKQSDKRRGSPDHQRKKNTLLLCIMIIILTRSGTTRAERADHRSIKLRPRGRSRAVTAITLSILRSRRTTQSIRDQSCPKKRSARHFTRLRRPADSDLPRGWRVWIRRILRRRRRDRAGRFCVLGLYIESVG
jgi:hypothetical protein